ncbi:MAG: RDD family protein [Xanthomonadales bacterium]|nr:RDD family protein [Xanthomonadales bacterium]
MNTGKTVYIRPSRLRRVGAYVYELLPLAAVLYGAAFLALPLTGGEAVGAGNPWFQFYLLVCVKGYFLVTWRYGGQTLAMRAWRLHALNADGTPMSWRQAIVRFWVAVLGWVPAGLGHLWMLVDRQHRTWHDRLARTVVLQRE